MTIDPVTLQILANHCAAATESMAHTLVRTAHSTFVKETEDFTTGLATVDGKTFASPFDLGATWFVGLDYEAAIKMIDVYEEGDLCLTNDPYSGFVCTHTPDVHLWLPVFHHGELICFAVGHIHNTDVGGAVPASLSRANTEIFQEGIRIPPRKLYKRGELNQELLDLMLINVRMPEQNWGDLKAQIAAMRTGARKVTEMIDRFGLKIFRAGMTELLDHAEKQARRLIEQMPDGEYFFADYMDEDSVDGHPCRLAVNMIVKGDEIEFDFSQSDPQVTASLNIPTGGNERHVLLMIPLIYVLYTMDNNIFLNSGLIRPARSRLPVGSIVNPIFPAAVGMRSLGIMRLSSCLFGAFAQALPDLIPCASGDGGPLINVRTTDVATGRKLMANLDPITGGAGGTAFRDGTEGSGANFGFLKNTPVEINEAEVPVKILKYGLERDSGGAGKWRGGNGTVLEFQTFSPNTTITARNRDRSHFTSWGAKGGAAGAVSSFFLNPGTDQEVNLGNTDVVTIAPGDIIRIASSGAGGWGDPLDRDPERVLTDVRCGFVSLEAAKTDYKVVIRNDKIEVDETNTLRKEAKQNGFSHNGNGAFGFNQYRRDFEALWTPENYDVLMKAIWRLPVDWRFFVKHQVFSRLKLLDDDARLGDGSEVMMILKDIAEEYPDVAQALL
ncbi:MAG: hydantoin utilization protein B [Dehalococcoidales bacterium]|jgi:N-methylhydantoinase B|nr:hydantoin utilization protein B [Dehalococcoidales bacterium]|tara:strand:+ start:1437 stop:3443 length:2007 start_codon:yes stop_codon:yes gene_type:complete